MRAPFPFALGTACLVLASTSSAQSVCFQPPTTLPKGGSVLALSGDTLFMAQSTPSTVLVFERGPGGWSETQALTGAASSVSELDTDGQTLAVGYASLGEAWLFERVGGVWALQTIIAPPGVSSGFGQGVAVDGDRLAVVDATTTFTFYRQTGSTWDLESSSTFTPYSTTRSVELDGDNLLLGIEAPVYGSALVVPYRWNGGEWVAEPMLTMPGGAGDGKLAVDGDRFVTADWSCTICLNNIDQVQVYERSAGQWTFVQTLSPSGFWSFGEDVDLDGERLAVLGTAWGGSWIPGQPSPNSSGVVRLMNHEGGVWNVLTDLYDGDGGGWGSMVFDQGVVVAGSGSAAVVWEQDFNPEVYCVPGTTAQGCNPSMGWQGEPSTLTASGFDVTTGGLEGQVTGLLFFGTSGRQFLPWGNSSSTQCVVPPVQRTGLQVATGTPGQCDGVMTLDFNAWMSAHSSKAPGPGDMVQFQTWFRDPQNTAKTTTSLSDALEFSICQ